MIKKYLKQIITELTQASDLFANINISKLQKNIISSNHIVCCGAGRMGYASRAFSMRLSHLGFKSFYFEDTNVPHLSTKDILIIASGSGQTKTMLNLAQIAKKNKVKIALITCNSKSLIAKIANIVIKIDTPSKTDKHPRITSIQPMTTLTEQFLFIFYDALVLSLMNKLHLSSTDLSTRHSNLE
ncbi:SIS domain-containing protein [Patescibacteria group bacterium]|nr:SIS domain-containing protein [Patescibacteria group bacterium]